MARNFGGADEELDCAVRDACRVEGKLLPCGRRRRAAILFGLATDEYTEAKFSCTRSFWGIGVHRGRRKNRGLAEAPVFSYSLRMLRVRWFVLHGLIVVFTAFCASRVLAAEAPQTATSAENSPVVSKVEPPNWWLRLTPQLMVLLSGHHLEATGVSCNLADLVVERTQATAGGDYL